MCGRPRLRAGRSWRSTLASRSTRAPWNSISPSPASRRHAEEQGSPEDPEQTSGLSPGRLPLEAIGRTITKEWPLRWTPLKPLIATRQLRQFTSEPVAHEVLAALATTLLVAEQRSISHAYDDGRVAERILIGASMLGLGH